MSKKPYKDMSEEELLEIVTEDGWSLRFILNAGIAPSEAVLLVATKYHGFLIRRILKAGIITSEAVQIAAVSDNGHNIIELIRHDITPSKAVQLAAVNRANPVYVTQHMLKAKMTPCEEVQLRSVIDSEFIFPKILNVGIIPSQEVINAHYLNWEL